MKISHEDCEKNNEIQDLGSLHHYRTEIPNIIFQLGLDVWEFKTYCVFKKTAGDSGSCFKSNSTLSSEVGCRIPTLIKIKKSLEKKGLIKIMKRTHANGGSMPDLIQIVDIWPENMNVMTELYYPVDQEKKEKIWGKNPIEGGSNPKLGGGVNAVNGGSKRRLHKEDHKEEDHKEEYHHHHTSSSKSPKPKPPTPSEPAAPDDEEFWEKVKKEKELSKENIRTLKKYPLLEVKRALRISENIKPKKSLIALLINILTQPDYYEDPKTQDAMPKEKTREEKEKMLKELEKNREYAKKCYEELMGK